MKFTLRKTVGEMEFTFEDVAESHLEFFQKAAFFAQLPRNCECGSTEVVPQYRKTDEGYKYCWFECLACHKQLKYGQFRDSPGSLFVKEWERPQPKMSKAQ